MKDLETRKRLLVAESEVYRQTLRLDVQNLRLYSVRMQRKLATYNALRPVLLAVLPVATSLLGRKSAGTKQESPSLVARLMAGWRMYKNIQPLIASLLAQYAAGQACAVAEEQTQAQSRPSAEPEESSSTI